MFLKRNLIVGENKLTNFVNLKGLDSELVRKWRNNKAVRKWMYCDKIISFSEHRNYLKKLKGDQNKIYWLVKNKNLGYLGVISLVRVDRLNKNAYLGIYADPAKENSGAGEELMKCLKNAAFKVMRLHTLKLEVLQSNRHAESFFKKAGFKIEGRLKEFVRKDGKWLDAVVMGLKNHDKENDGI